MRIINCVQGTPEWWEAKMGVPSASNFDRIFAAVSRKPSASQDRYVDELVSEVVSPQAPYFTKQGRPVNTAIEHGLRTENEAADWYALETGFLTSRVGFCLHDSGHFGCSPDRLVGNEGGLELKCPQRDTHEKYLEKGVVPTGYLCQVHGCLIVSNRKWWDFMSYFPGLPPLLVRVVPDEFTWALADELKRFCKKYHAALRAAGLNPPRDHDTQRHPELPEHRCGTGHQAGVPREHLAVVPDR